MTALNREHKTFKKAIIFSFTAHLCLFIFILLSPYFPKSSSKGMIQYVNIISFPGEGGGQGGGPGGGGSGSGVITNIPARESLKELTTPQKFQQEPPSSLTYPVEKPKKESNLPENKKTVIQKSKKSIPKSSTTKDSGIDYGTKKNSGSGLRIGGIGTGSGGGGGFGSEYSSQIGLSNFPFTYYLQIIHGKISSNWYISQISPGIKGSFHTTIFFKIFKDGRISEPKIEESSKIRSLDLSAIRAVRSSTPFPPLPKDYEDEYLGIHLIFEHSE